MRYILFASLGTTMRETAISRALANGGGPDVGEEWVVVYNDLPTFFPVCILSPHLGAPNALDDIWEMSGFTDDAREKTARQYLIALRKGVPAFGEVTYPQVLRDLVVAKGESITSVGAGDIPDDLAEQVVAAYGEK